MIIIFEGIDTAGKGTVIKELNKELNNYTVLRGSSFEITEGKNEEELAKEFNKFTDMDNVILDRYIYSNLTYANIYSDYSMISVEDARDIESKLDKKAIVVYLIADESVIKERFNSRGEEYVSENEITKILNRYDEVLKDCTLDVLEYNTGKESLDFIVKDLLNYINFVD